MVGAKWDEAAGKWRVDIRRPKESAGATSDADGDTEVFEDTADLLFTGLGSLSRWNWPDIEGLRTFKGIITHSAKWDVGNQDGLAPTGLPTATTELKKSWEEDVKEWGNKRVAVIGVVSWPCCGTCSSTRN